MAVCKQTILRSKKCTLACLLIVVHASKGINLGLFAGDLKRQLNPLIIKKHFRHSPVFINVFPKPFSTLPPLIPHLPSKPPPLELFEPLLKLKSPLASKLRLMPPVILPPLIPKLPLIPIIPPVLPPVLPLLPLSVPILPRIPRIPKLTNPFGPIRVPILGRTKLQKALGSELSPVKIPSLGNKHGNLLDKLQDLKRKGSLTTAEFIRFKKLLLRK